MSDDGKELVLSYSERVARTVDPTCPDCQSKHWRATDARWLLHGATWVALVCQSCGRGYSVTASAEDQKRM